MIIKISAGLVIGLLVFLQPAILYASIVQSFTVEDGSRGDSSTDYKKFRFTLPQATVIGSFVLGNYKADVGQNESCPDIYNSARTQRYVASGDLTLVNGTANEIYTYCKLSVATSSTVTLPAGTYLMQLEQNTGSPTFRTNSSDLYSLAEFGVGANANATFTASSTAPDMIFSFCNISTCEFTIGGFATSTRISDVIYPLTGDVTSSTNVNLLYEYFFNSEDFGEYDIACAYIQNITLSQEVIPPCVDIIASGTSVYSQSVTLNPDQFYQWRPYLGSASSTAKIYGDWNTFSVLTVANQTVLPAGFENASSTNKFVKIYDVMQRKFPFAYGFDAVRLVSGFGGNSTTSTSTTLNLTVNSFGGVATTVPIDLQAISQFTLLVWLRNLMTGVIYVTLAYGIAMYVLRSMGKGSSHKNA